MLTFFVLEKIDLSKVSVKKTLFYGFLVSLLPLFSLPTLFLIASFFIFELIRKKDIRKLILFNIPILIIFSIYYFTTLLPQKYGGYMHAYWDYGFLSFNFAKNIRLLKMNLKALHMGAQCAAER